MTNKSDSEKQVGAAVRAGWISYEAFLSAQDEHPWAEWVDGEIVDMTPVGWEHQRVVRFLVTLLDLYVQAHKAGEIVFEPFQMKTGPDLPGRAPDIMFLSKENLKRLRPTHVEGPADLVVEVVSPGSRGRDRGDKFFEYEKGGVCEFWLVDPERKQAEFYVLGKTGVYRPVMPDADGIYRSTILKGLWLNVAWLWEDPHPASMSILKQWKLL
jgi:Uma2 family endonuclease